jgi:mannose-1-phosphate guanylyltransferase
MNYQDKVQALVLAAGFGKRLGSLTKKKPKPLLPFFHQPILYHTLDKIKYLNITDTCINSHYLWEKIKFSLENYTPLQPTLLIEKKNLLGTGGAIRSLSLRKPNLLVINADIIFSFELSRLLDFHLNKQAFATMVVRPMNFSNHTPLWCENGLVRAIGESAPKDFKGQKKSFACIHILSQDFVQKIPKKEPHCIIEDYRYFINKGYKISYIEEQGFWYDLGSITNYLQGHLDFCKNLEQKSDASLFSQKIVNNFNFTNKSKTIQNNTCYLENNLFANNINLGKNTILTNSCIIEKDVQIKNSILLPGAIVKQGRRINNQIIQH